MSVSVTLIVRRENRDEETDLDTRNFDTLPRIGDTISFAQGTDRHVSPISGIAFYRVIEVEHLVYAGYRPDVRNRPSAHAYVYIEPRTAGDADTLRLLYEAEASRE